jgi:transcription elongation factor SPT6
MDHHINRTYTNNHLTEAWLTTYTEANPRHGSYNFAIDPTHPGYFYLMFKANHNTPCVTWPAKVIPSGFELQGNKYPNMQALRNGFKTLCANHGAGGVRRAPQTNGR